MPIDVTDVSEFTDPIQSVATGDVADEANFLLAPQGLSNRTRWLKNLTAGLSAGSATLTIDPGNTAPGMKQTQATVGGGKVLQIVSQAAATGSVASGGHMALTMGSDDPTGVSNPPAPVQLYVGHAKGPNPDPINSIDYWSIAFLKHLPGEVACLTMGGGDNLVGHNCVGVEISCSAQNPTLNIATDGAQISLIVSPALGASVPNEVTVAQTGTDNVNEAAWAFTTGVKHATGGDASCIQLHNTTDSIGSGQLRWLDIFEGGTRQFDIRPNPGLPGAIMGCPSGGYFYIGVGSEAAIAMRSGGGTTLQVDAAGVFWNNSGAYGVRLAFNGGTDWSFTATSNITSLAVNFADNTTNSATGSKLTLAGQNATGTTSIGGDLELKVGTGTSANGSLDITHVATAASASAGAATLPANPVEFLVIKRDGTTRKIPLYAA